MPLIGRPPKRPRTQSELAEMASRLGADWRPGDNVMTWIRRHEGATSELSRVIRDGWSWTDLGLAMAIAGIRYQAAAAISGDVLRKKAGKARADERNRRHDQALRNHRAVAEVDPPLRLLAAPQDTSPLPTLERPERGMSRPTPAMRQTSPAGEGSASSEEPFRVVRLRAGRPPATARMPAQPTPYPEAETEHVSDEEIVRRVLGKA